MKSCLQTKRLEINTTGFNVLFVDDDLRYLRMIKTFMDNTVGNGGTYIGYAESAEQALTELRKRPFHLIFTDFNMADMNGIELAKKVRNIISEISIVMVTGSPISSEITMDAINAGISKVVTKPINLNILREIITEEERKMKSGASVNI